MLLYDVNRPHSFDLCIYYWFTALKGGMKSVYQMKNVILIGNKCDYDHDIALKIPKSPPLRMTGNTNNGAYNWRDKSQEFISFDPPRECSSSNTQDSSDALNDLSLDDHNRGHVYNVSEREHLAVAEYFRIGIAVGCPL